MSLPLLPLARSGTAVRHAATPARAREPLTPARALQLRRRMAAGDFDTAAHASALAGVLLGWGSIEG